MTLHGNIRAGLAAPVLSALLFVSMLCVPHHAATYYVSDGAGNDAYDGLTWSSAKLTIQAAVDLAVDGDTVVVTNGVYRTGGRPGPGLVLSNRVMVLNRILLQSVNGPGSTVIEGSGPNGPGAVRCVMLRKGTCTGFTISNGHVLAFDYFNPYEEMQCGGVSAYTGGLFNAAAMVSNCIIVRNGGLSEGDGATFATLVDCTLVGNSANEAYPRPAAFRCVMSNCVVMFNHNIGANYCTLYRCVVSNNYGTGVRSCLVYDSVITRNTPPNGGVAGADASTLYRCDIAGNYATNVNGAGGAYASHLDGCTIRGNQGFYGGGTEGCYMQGCLVTGNIADIAGGVSGGAATNCTIAGNISRSYAGGMNEGTLVRCKVLDNVAGTYGGGAYSAGGWYSCVMRDCLVAGNIASNAGGGGYKVTMFNCTVCDNVAVSNSGGLHGDVYGISRAANSIVYNNRSIGNPVTSNYYLWYAMGYWWSAVAFTNSCTAPLPPDLSAGNITAGPQMVNPAARDYHLQSASPCIDAGLDMHVTTALDLDGYARIGGAHIDLGAYEYRVGPPNEPPVTPTNVAPASGAVDQPLSPVLSASAFSDPDTGDTHGASEWQLNASASFDAPLWSSGVDTSHLLSITVSAVLSPTNWYWWRVRYRDSRGGWSGWSSPTSFRTVYVANTPPATPSALIPAHGDTNVTLTPLLLASAFSDPDVGDTCAGAQFQVCDTYGGTLWDSGLVSPGTTTSTVPAGVLWYNWWFSWRVRYEDSRGGWSQWSSWASFQTCQDPAYVIPGTLTKAVIRKKTIAFNGIIEWNDALVDQMIDIEIGGVECAELTGLWKLTKTTGKLKGIQDGGAVKGSVTITTAGKKKGKLLIRMTRAYAVAPLEGEYAVMLRIGDRRLRQTMTFVKGVAVGPGL